MDNEKKGDQLPIEKFDIKLKTKSKDGAILQLHHTVRSSNGETRRIRFSTGTFDDVQEKLACSDNVGNLFILDFSDLKFWKLTDLGPCSALWFVPHRSDKLVIANSKKHVNFVDIETGCVTLSLTGHTAPIKHISFSNNKINNFLTASPAEAILWEMRNYTKYFTLNTYAGAQIQQILFSPAGEYLVACFQNDTVQIWKHDTMKSVKQIIPNDMKHLKSIAFTMNGRAMAMAGLSSTLILFSMDTWKALKSINLSRYEISGVHQMAFIPQLFDGGANKVLAILGNDCMIKLLDLESMSIIHKIFPETSGIRKFIVSPTGKYFLCVLQLGEMNIYNTSQVMDLALMHSDSKVKKDLPSTSTTTTHRSVTQESSFSKAEVEHKMRNCMDSARLRRILMQYGEYPEKFRSIIWKSLLNTPHNKAAYVALVDKGIHSAYKDIEKQFTIHSAMTLKSLKRLLSCLAHWCPLFGVMKFLPGFVFPFVKVLHKDPLLLFESVATILLNHCQLWFEYAPFPPISILAMIENILAEHDQQLLDHFCQVGATSQTYALKILETAFSEVLTCSEWLILWDHILSNEPAFIVMAVVSYSIVQKNAIRRLKTHEQLENFFHMQNPICKKAFLKKTYILLNETSDDIHPRKFFNSFMSLEKGDCYQQFTGYPKTTICLKLAKKERKNTVKNDSLRELTTKSQEKIIKERVRAYASESKTVDTEEEEEDDDEVTQKHSQRLKKKGHHSSHQDKGDFNKKLIKEELIESIMYPVQEKGRNDSKHSRKEKEKSQKSLPTRSKPRMKSLDRTDSLEREIEALMHNYSESDSEQELNF